MKYMTDLDKHPLTESEKIFSEENYNLFLWYIGSHKLNEDEADALTIPYLIIVRKYLSTPRLQQYKFATILIRQLNSYRRLYYRRLYSKKYRPEGGICSLNSPINKNDKEAEELEMLIMGKCDDAERKVIDQEIFKEFMDFIGNFSQGVKMKIVLYLLLEGYSEKEIIGYIQNRFHDQKFTRQKFTLLMKQLRFAFQESGLESLFNKTSSCQVVYYDILEYAIKEKIIKRQGAKLLYNDTVIGKGRDEGKRYLQEHQLETKEIMDKLKARYLCVG